MTDIFISYRQGDGGWAGRLASDLERHFDVFFDTSRDSIDFGDSFPDRIDTALEECRVFLAVIGPEWVNDRNMARLVDPKDWVRREVEAALSAPGRVRTVPVLAGNAPLPGAASLPQMMQPLVAVRHALTLTNDKWRTDCDLLITRANGWLTGQLASQSGPRAIPTMLPYLCDRVEQQDALIDLIGAGTATRPAYVCILHGHKWEFHGSFLDRLRYRRVLEDLFDAREAGLAFCVLQWNREKAKSGQYGAVLRRALKTDAMQRPAATEAELLDHLHRLAQPLVAVLQITWADYELCGPALVPALVDAWRALFADVAKLESALPRSSFVPAVLWINVTYEDDTQTLATDGLDGLLPRLMPVTQGNVADWLGMDEVKRVATGHEAQLLALTDDERSYVEKGKVRMLHFVDAVRRILASA